MVVFPLGSQHPGSEGGWSGRALGPLLQPEPGHLFDMHLDVTGPFGHQLPLPNTPLQALHTLCIPQY